MKISITFNGNSFLITPDIMQVLQVKAFQIENAINLFNKGIESLANDIQRIEQLPAVKLRDYLIKYDLSNREINFELDEDSWYYYKRFLCQIEGRKAISAKRKDELFANGNITITTSSNFYNSILSGSVIPEERLSGDILVPDFENSDPNSPFYFKTVVFTGVLEKISRINAAEKVKSMGADINNTISPLTDFVIVGTDPGPSKMKKIEKFNAAGANIRIIYEPEFLDMLQD